MEILKKSAKFVLKVLVVVVIVAAILMLVLVKGCGAELNTHNVPAKIVDNEGNHVEMTAKELEALQDENEAKFEKYYVGAKISFTGTVEEIKTNFTWNGSSIIFDAIYFEEGWYVFVLHGSENDLLGELEVGDKVEVESQIYDAHMGIRLQGSTKNAIYGTIYGEEDLLKTKLSLVD